MTVSSSFTHIAFLFIRSGTRKGKVYGYWKDGGRFKMDSDSSPFAYIDMLPRGGWDGRIRFVKIGDPPPENDPPAAPSRPGEDTESEEQSDG